MRSAIKISNWGALLPGLLFGVLLTGMFGADRANAARTVFSGQATVVRASVLGNTVTLADTGPLPPGGGALETTLLEADVPGLLAAEVLHAAAVGQGRESRAEASVANLALTVAGHNISAGFLMANATAQCRGGDAAVTGRSEIVALVIDGQSIVVSGQPNQTIQLGDLRVVINEQSSSVSGGMGDITVTALHVSVDGLADVAISTAHADISCAGEQPRHDFVTGGGFITGTPSGAPANFGVAGGLRSDGFWGHLTYIDHGSGMRVHGTGVTAYTVVDETTRQIDGTARVNGQDGFTYRVVVSDRGEPGRNDTFEIELSNGYSAGGTLVGGNIQLHGPGK